MNEVGRLNPPTLPVRSRTSPFPLVSLFPGRGALLASLALLLLVLALAAPAPAEAQRPVLVGNNLQTDVPDDLDLDRDRAQAFTTGSVSEGYTLTSVQIGVATGGSPTDYSVKIVSAGASGPGADVIGTLDPPSYLTPGIANSFTGSVGLDASTTYYILLDLKTADGAVQLKGTQVVLEDPGGAAGWSIANSSHKRSADDSGSWTGDHTLKVIIYGYSKAVPVLDSAEIDGATLVLNYDNHLDAVSGTAAGQFAIKADGGAAQAGTGISISGRQVTLTAPRVAPGQTVTVSYAKPGTNPLKGLNQLEVAGFSDHTVTNNTRALVSNTGQAVGAPIGDDFDHAQAFTTGGASGYKLTSIAVRFQLLSTHTDWDVQLWSNSGTNPGSRLATLTKPPSVADGVNIFRASGTGIDLAARTTYWVVWNNHSSAAQIRMYIVDTGSQAEDWGGAAGWSIADRGRSRMALSTGSDWKSTPSRMISVNGYSKGGRAPTVPGGSFPGGGFPAGGGGGGGGGPSGPTPSEADFEWNVQRDIEALDAGNDLPTGAWSDGATLWVADNASGAGDAVYAYDLETGERLAASEFELAEANRAPRGIWSDGETVWISDSGQERLFAYDLETGERAEEREIVLAKRNKDARGIWSDGLTMWVLDGVKDALFAYELASGELRAEYTLADANSDPRGIWSDGVTLWVSDHGAKRLFAYRLPALPEAEPPEDPPALERVVAEDFEEPGRVGNNSPRGIWSDGAVMYVADALDGRVYTYNMPDAIDARLASLELEGVDIGEFSPLRTEYASEHVPHGNIATLTAVPAQEDASVHIEPADHDGDLSNGHHLRLLHGLEVTITVTSQDGSRERVYRVALADVAEEQAPADVAEEQAPADVAEEQAPADVAEEQAPADVAEEQVTGPSASCLRGAVSIGFSLVVSEGGSLDDLVSCAHERHVTALYALSDGDWVSYSPDAPDFVNQDFAELFPEGVPALTPLTVRSEGPATPAPPAPAVAEPFATCLLGEISDGFSLVVYEGGSVVDLEACGAGLGVTAVYALVEGEWESYALGAPDFVNAAFLALFTDGVPAAMPLTVKRAGP